MRVKDILAILGVAAATTAFVVGLLGPARVVATDQSQALVPQIAQPKLTVDGCVFTLRTDKPAYQPGEKPTLQLEATNPTGKPVETALWVSMSAGSPPSPLARVMIRPRPLWTEKCLVTNLKPGQTKTFSLPTETELPTGETVSITMSDKDLTVLARTFSVGSTGLPVQGANQLTSVNQPAP